MNLSKIPKHLREKIDSIPLKPGVYKMKDIEGNIIYVGKSKTLKSRVKSYFYTNHESNKLKLLVFHIYDIDYIVTDTHLEALILECTLIKKLKPMYNSQFKNHKKYMYLKINDFNKLKPISIVEQREDANCFGPYRSKGILEEVIKFFQKIYPITKSEGIYKFTYKIFPENINEDTFEKNKENLIEVFSTNECMEKFLLQIETKMMDAAGNCQFETASIYRDIEGYMKYLYNTKSSEANDFEGRKILMGEKIDGGYKIFFISNGSIILKRKYQELLNYELEKFLADANDLEGRLLDMKNEKRALDFKSIVYGEIKDQESKTVVFLENDNYLKLFIDKLQSL